MSIEFLWRKPAWSFLFLYQLTFLLMPAFTLGAALAHSAKMMKFVLLTPVMAYALLAPFALYLALVKRKNNIVWLAGSVLAFTCLRAAVHAAPVGRVFVGSAEVLLDIGLWITSIISIVPLYREAAKVEMVTLGCGTEHVPEDTTSNAAFIAKHFAEQAPSNRRHAVTAIIAGLAGFGAMFVMFGSAAIQQFQYEVSTPKQEKLDNALTKAIDRGNMNAAEELVSQGANIETCGKFSTALGVACAQGDLRAMRWFVEHGADKQNANALVCVMSNGAKVKGGDPERCRMVRYLLAHGAKVNEAAAMLPLPVAIAQRYPKDIIELMIAQGAPVSGFSGRAQGARLSPLLAAVRANRDDIVDLLLSHGANVNEIDLRVARYGAGYETSPLFEAVDSNNESLVHKLIKAGADISAPNSDGRTPLVLAAMKTHSDCWKELVKAGAATEPVKRMAADPAKRAYMNADMLRELKI